MTATVPAPTTPAILHETIGIAPAAPSPGRVVLTALRPRQWVKNVLVAVAPLAAGELLTVSHIVRLALVFAMMCAAASSTYLLNDIGDRERDRNHPTKRLRPIAAGWLPVSLARTLAVALAVSASMVGLALGATTFAALAGYLALTVSYSRWLKHVPFLEMVVVGAGFVLRVIVGAAATTTAISMPFLVIVAAGAMFLATGKRYGELRELGSDSALHRPVLAHYTEAVLKLILQCAGIAAVIGYVGWSLTTRFGQFGMVWLLGSLVCFLVATGRGAAKVFAGGGGDPTELILGDRILLAAGAAAAVLALAGLYLP